MIPEVITEEEPQMNNEQMYMALLAVTVIFLLIFLLVMAFCYKRILQKQNQRESVVDTRSIDLNIISRIDSVKN